MSQPTNNTTHDKSYDVLKIVAMALGLAGLIILPLGLYAIGQLLATHMAFSDLNLGYGQSAFYQVAYNATHVQAYQQMAQLNQGEAINLANQDDSTISLVMLGFGILADVPLALKLREWVAEL